VTPEETLTRRGGCRMPLAFGDAAEFGIEVACIQGMGWWRYAWGGGPLRKLSVGVQS